VTGTIAAGTLVAGRLSARSPNDTVSIGCIGVGGRGTHHLKNLLGMSGVAIRAICDIDPSHMEIAQKRVMDAGQVRPDGYSDWKQLLERKDIDAVVSALPCYLHAPNYLDVIAAGKDLYAEKPLCLTPEECWKIVEATQKSKQIVQVGFQRRADPFFVEAMESVHKGELGQLIEGRIEWSNAWGPLGGWFGHKDKSGDWMVEQACHNWDVLNWANKSLPVRAAGFGRSKLFRDVPIVVDNVTGRMAVEPDRDVHDYYSGVAVFENGVIVNVIHSWVVPGKFDEEHTRLVGTRAGIDFNSGTLSYRKELKLPDRMVAQPSNVDSSKLAMEAFLTSVRTRKPPIATVEHGRDAVLAALLMKKAVYNGKVFTLEELWEEA
jgi:predicted dehydrogenase